MDVALRDANKSGITYNGSWCAPLINFATQNLNKKPAYLYEVNAAFKKIVEDTHISTVIILRNGLFIQLAFVGLMLIVLPILSIK